MNKEKEVIEFYYDDYTEVYYEASKDQPTHVYNFINWTSHQVLTLTWGGYDSEMNDGEVDIFDYTRGEEVASLYYTGILNRLRIISNKTGEDWLDEERAEKAERDGDEDSEE